MNSAIQAADDLLGAMADLARHQAASNPGGQFALDDARNLIYSIQRKCRFAAHHLDVLSNIDWQRVSLIGTVNRATNRSETMTITVNKFISIETKDREATLNLAMIAFDGVVASCVNIADTVGRLVNVAYDLGIDRRYATMPTVLDKIDPQCKLATAIKSYADYDELLDMRRLRGECQHADIVNVLRTPETPWDGPDVEPCVPPGFAQSRSQQDRQVSRYSAFAVSNAERFLVTVSQVITSDPISSVIAVARP